jgi:hypothetical protein
MPMPYQSLGSYKELVPGQAEVFSDEPLGLVNNIEPVGMPYTLPADCPSLGSSGLVEVSDIPSQPRPTGYTKIAPCFTI